MGVGGGGGSLRLLETLQGEPVLPRQSPSYPPRKECPRVLRRPDAEQTVPLLKAKPERTTKKCATPFSSFQHRCSQSEVFLFNIPHSQRFFFEHPVPGTTHMGGGRWLPRS